MEACGAEVRLFFEEFDLARLRERLEQFDGLLIPGGHDIDPSLYGGAPHPAVELVAPERDSLEMEAARIALERKIPTLGICRGIQVVNVAFGGTLYEDIDDQYEPPNGLRLRHRQTPDHARSDPTHDVDLKRDANLVGVLGATSLKVNSLHHQAVRRVASDLEVVATARDGIVEALESRGDHPFYVAVQWHPEEMVGRDEPSRRLFRAFVHHAAERAQARAVA